MPKRTLALPLVFAAASLGWAQDITEPRSGVHFAARRDGETLLGLGLRVKKIAFVKAKVYVVGLYVGDTALRGPLAAHKGKPLSAEFFRDLVWGDFQKSLVLRFVRDVGREQIGNAMRKALACRTEPGLLEVFVGYFAELKDGQECVLRWAPGGSLEVTMAGQPRPPLSDKAFAAAVFGLYLGDEPLQEDIKQGLVSRASQAFQAP
jgi:hypothetical protein